MKKALLTLLLPLCVNSVFAQGTFQEGVLVKKNKEWRKKFVNFNFTNTQLKLDGEPDLKSNYGGSFTVGRTFFLHRPIGNSVRFGIDATWFDLNYTNYDIEHITYGGTEKYQHHQGDVSMHLGPSITIAPARKVALHAYGRVAPTLTGLYRGDTEEGSWGYSTMWVAGGNISVGPVGVGLEKRWGKTTYKPFDTDGSDGQRAETSGYRAYVTFKF